MTDQHELQQQLGEIGIRYLKRTLGEIGVLRELLQKLHAGESAALREIERLSHKIYGSGAMFGFDGLSRHARAIELAAAEGKATPDLNHRLERQIAELAAVVEATARERGVTN